MIGYSFYPVPEASSENPSSMDRLYINAYIHTYIHAYIHACTHTHTHTSYIHTYMVSE